MDNIWTHLQCQGYLRQNFDKCGTDYYTGAVDDRNLSEESRHPIRVVSARTGLPQDLIRVWERRYHAVVPARSKTGRRLYSDPDIEKLRLLRRAVDAGRRIGDVAGLSLEALRDLVAEDHRESPGAETRTRTRAPADTPEALARGLVAEAVEALETFDRHRLEAVLDEASVQLGGPALREHLIVPLLNLIGERWQDGTMRIVQEHMASTIVRSFMTSGRNGKDRAHAPRIVVTTPSGQHHELGALLAAAVAEEAGWDVYFMGPDLPAEEIAVAVRQLGARAIALSVTTRGEGRVISELARLRGLVADDVPVFVGGGATGALRDRLEEIGVSCPRNLVDFRSDLQSLLA